MKKILAIISLSLGVLAHSQVKLHNTADTSIGNENPFLDASGYGGFSNNVGKGLYFPKTDLTKWEFKTSGITPGKFNTYFDGMMVYNSVDGQTIADASKGGQRVSVKPGFYYFKNPNKNAPEGNVNDGKWVKLVEEGSSIKVGSTTGMTCKAETLGTINFGDVTIKGNVRKAFGFCTKDANNTFVWAYMVAGNHIFSSDTPEFGQGL